jgi:hypothetical protein
MVLTRLQDNSQWPSLPAGMIQPRQDMYYLAFWGISGVVLGSLLPWIDNVWESTFGREVEDDASTVDAASSAEPDASTDWTLVMRAIGAFVGIVFAIVSTYPSSRYPVPLPDQAGTNNHASSAN